jgi:hypothetical protein
MIFFPPSIAALIATSRDVFILVLEKCVVPMGAN